MRIICHLKKKHFKDEFNDTYLSYFKRPKNYKREFYLEKSLTSLQPVSESLTGWIGMCERQGGEKGADMYQEAFSFSKMENSLRHHKLSLI